MGFFSNLFKKNEDFESYEVYDNHSQLIYSQCDKSFMENANAVFQIDDVFTITGRGTTVVGKVLKGSFSVGDCVCANGIDTQITGVEQFRKRLDTVNEGDNAGLMLDGIERKRLATGNYITK